MACLELLRQEAREKGAGIQIQGLVPRRKPTAACLLRRNV